MPRSRPASKYKPDLTEEQTRARDAVLKAQRMRPQIQAFVRVITRNPRMQVKFTAQKTATDGKTVWVQVPMRLADMGAHDRGECGTRDAVGVPVCHACKIMEEVHFYLYHEMAHLLAGSFIKIPGDVAMDMLLDAITRVVKSPKRQDRLIVKLEERYDRLPMDRKNYVELSQGLSEWFPLLLNVVEDIRVNDWMVQARPGTRGMFFRYLLASMVEGAQVKPGEFKPWSDMDPNAQLAIGFFFKASGLDVTEFLHEQVVADLATEPMEELLNLCEQLESISETWYATVRFVEEAKALGYYPDPDDSEDEEPEEEQDEQSGEGESGEADDCEGGQPDEQKQDGKSGSGKGSSKPAQEGEDGIEADPDQANPEEGEDPEESDGDQSQEGGQDGASGDDGADADQGRRGGDAGLSGQPGGAGGAGDDLPPQNMTPEQIESMIAQATAHGDDQEDPANPYSGAPEMPGPSSPTDDADDIEDDWYLPDHGQPKEPLKQALYQAEHFDTPSRWIQFTREYTDVDDPKARSWQYGRHWGSQVEAVEVPRTVVTASIARMRRIFQENKATRMEGNLKRGKQFDPRTMGRRIPVDDPRIMRKRTRPGKKDHSVLIGLDVSGSTANGLDRHIVAMGAAQAELCEATGVEFAIYAHTGMGSYLEIYIVKTWNEPWGPVQKKRLAMLRGSTANLDGHTMEYYRKAIERRPTTDKLIMYFTDGEMPAENYDEELWILQREIGICKKVGIRLVGVGVGTDSPKEHGLDTIRCDRMDDIPGMIQELEKRLVKQ